MDGAGSAARLPADLRAAWKAHGDHAHALNALLGERAWRGPRGEVVPYADTGRAWVAAGAPIAAAALVPAAARAFEDAAAAAGRIPVWFAIEHPERIPHAERLVVGALPEWSPAGWAEVVRQHRRVREQLRRARKKGVTIRAISLEDIAPADRVALQRLERAWVETRRMEPMGFVVAHRQDSAPLLRRAWIAEVGGVAVAYVTATPMPARNGWLLEDLRRDGAPNGTSELMFDSIVRALAADGAEWITPGMVPLVGSTRRWLAGVRHLARPLYDFDGLAFFRTRMHPDRWRPIYLMHPPQVSAPRAVVEVLRAFSGGSLFRFGSRSLLRRPPGLAWVLAAGLVPWTLGIAAMAIADAESLLGFSRGALWGWAAFDATLVVLLWMAARQRRLRHFVIATAAAGADAMLSVQHLAMVGLGGTALQQLLRIISAAAPLLATALLGYASLREWRARRPDAATPPARRPSSA